MTTIFETLRLTIRNWIPKADAEQAFAIYSDPDVTRFLGIKVEESIQTQQAALERVINYYAKLKKGTGFWAVVEKETRQIVGAVLLKQLPDNAGKPTQDYEVGWHLRKASWGKGYATEAGRAVIDHGLNILKLPVIYTVIKPENHASIRVAERLGMIPMGRTNKYYGVETELFKLDAFLS